MTYFFVMVYSLVITALKFAKCSKDTYISGGSHTTYSEYPHSVLLVVDCQQKFICGGSILNQNIVLTAAHCTEMCDSDHRLKIEVKYGHHDITKMKTTLMKHYVEHENYNSDSIINDICLMSTKDDIKLNNDVKRVIILEHPPAIEFGYVSGWGLTVAKVRQQLLVKRSNFVEDLGWAVDSGKLEDGKLKSLMKHTRSTIQSTQTCESIFGRLPPGIFCAGPLTGLGTALQGDSGGALVYGGYIQIGIVSHNVADYSLVAYTNVSYYMNWITIHSRRLYCANKL